MSKQYSLTLSMWGCYEMRRIRGKEHGVGAVRQQKKIIPAYSGPPSWGNDNLRVWAYIFI